MRFSYKVPCHFARTIEIRRKMLLCVDATLVRWLDHCPEPSSTFSIYFQSSVPIYSMVTTILYGHNPFPTKSPTGSSGCILSSHGKPCTRDHQSLSSSFSLPDFTGSLTSSTLILLTYYHATCYGILLVGMGRMRLGVAQNASLCRRENESKSRQKIHS